MFSLNSGGALCATNFKAKDCVTLLACANASSSHCLPLAFINKSTKRRCFKHMGMSSLPVHYFSQKKSWTNCKIFSKWFQQLLGPSVGRFCSNNGLEKTALLLLDNTVSHPSSTMLQSNNGKIKAMFLPPKPLLSSNP